MQFQTKEPAHGALASGCNAFEDSMLPNPLVVTNIQCRTVHEVDECGWCKKTDHESKEWQHTLTHQSEESCIANPVWEGINQMHADMFKVVFLELTIAAGMKPDTDSQSLLQRVSWHPVCYEPVLQIQSVLISTQAQISCRTRQRCRIVLLAPYTCLLFVLCFVTETE